MTGHYAQIAFTPTVRAHQSRQGSAAAYDRMAVAAPRSADPLGEDEAAFIESRDSIMIASVGETGWPYVQHRGGPPGFLQVLDQHTIGLPDFRGNKQYVTRGNLDHDERVALFMLDHVHQARMKIFGRARAVEPDEDPELIARLTTPDYPARVERALVIRVEAYDWNCRQHIPRMYPADLVEKTVSELKQRVAELESLLDDQISPRDPLIGRGPPRGSA